MAIRQDLQQAEWESIAVFVLAYRQEGAGCQEDLVPHRDRIRRYRQGRSDRRAEGSAAGNYPARAEWEIADRLDIHSAALDSIRLVLRLGWVWVSAVGGFGVGAWGLVLVRVLVLGLDRVLADRVLVLADRAMGLVVADRAMGLAAAAGELRAYPAMAIRPAMGSQGARVGAVVVVRPVLLLAAPDRGVAALAVWLAAVRVEMVVAVRRALGWARVVGAFEGDETGRFVELGANP